VNVLMAVEDDADIRTLVRFQFALDAAFEIDGEYADVDSAVAAAEKHQPDLVVLDHKLDRGPTGLLGAPLLKAAAPGTKIILFSASEELRVPASAEPAVDAFLLKTDIDRLVPLARKLLGLD
jgi:DNA-binding NarL/FixJ family response regulator